MSAELTENVNNAPMTTQDHARALLESLTCQTCGGNGFYFQHIRPEEGPSEPCSDCDGLGVVLPDEMVEAAARALYDVDRPSWMADARVTLVAGLREVAECEILASLENPPKTPTSENP